MSIIMFPVKMAIKIAIKMKLLRATADAYHFSRSTAIVRPTSTTTAVVIMNLKI